MTASTSWVPSGFEQATYSSWPMDDEIGLSMIRLWCEVLEDANPAYYDEGVARANGFDRVIAPPTMILPWCVPAEWRPTGPASSMAEEFRNEIPEYPHTIGLHSVQIHSRPLLLGERFTVHEFINPPSEPQETDRGFGRRQLRYKSLRDESGSEVSNIELEALRLRIPDSKDAPEMAAPEMPEFRGEPVRGPLDAAEGQVLPPLHMEISFKRCVKWVAASRDFFEAHHDPEYARRTGASNVYIGQHFFQGLIGRYVTDWTGPAGFLSRLEFKQWGRCFPGESVSVVGRVDAVESDAEGLSAQVEIAIGCDRGRLYDARATVSLR